LIAYLFGNSSNVEHPIPAQKDHQQFTELFKGLGKFATYRHE